MGNITLDNSLIDLTEFKASWQTQFYRAQTASLINTATSNGSARLKVEMTVETENLDKRNYVESVLLAAAYNFDSVTLELPDIFYKYRGSPVATGLLPQASVSAGSNTLIVEVGGATPTYPTSANVYQGMLLNFQGDTTLYRINSYTPATGIAIIFPVLRKAITTSTTIVYENPTFTGHIMNTPQAKYFNGALNYVSYDIDLDEVL
jgi:hypothetical protein